MNKYAKSSFFITHNPQHAFFDFDQTVVLAQKLADQNLQIPAWRDPVYLESDDKIVEFFGVINSINFCYTDFKTHKKFDIEYPEGSGKIWTGAFGMTMCFKRALNEGLPVLDPHFLLKLTEDQARFIFRHKTTPIPMFYERVRNLRNIGLALSLWFGSFIKIFEGNDFKFLDIVEQLTRTFSSYRDSSYLNGQPILFNKRAQLFPMMYHGRALSSTGALQPLRDPENFGAIADYEVPKILRMFGAIRYIPELAAEVDNGVIIKKNSYEEIEIRAITVVVMEKLLECVNNIRQEKQLNKVTMAELDYAVWNMGRGSEYKTLRHHYTYTTAY